ncbi:hypothetical protein MSG28_001243 [Choristoneura fumiferana]|uniref:Uncharacterized protein n=1 Tax=Choristoneura fumiferana TaxID=7141 RepID=A0ACC0K4A3_CHOFU|nr:hypothetical protein MSG28_001243 [Choristoneura fumiferana]
MDEAIKTSRGLLEQGHERQDELDDFDQVTESRQQAELATQDVPAIRDKVAAADASINNIAEELFQASDKAKDARDVAQKAQKEFAEKASENSPFRLPFHHRHVRGCDAKNKKPAKSVPDTPEKGSNRNSSAGREEVNESLLLVHVEGLPEAAHEIRKKASASRADAGKLRDEAEKLSTRVEGTAKQIEELEKQAADNTQLTRDAKMKVGQANTDAREAEKQVSKGLEDLKVITDELQNLPTLDAAALDRLQDNLNKVTADLKALDLDGKIEALKEAKKNHLRWMDQYKEEHKSLQNEVANVKDILDQLPQGCFKKITLEPTERPQNKPASYR